LVGIPQLNLTSLRFRRSQHKTTPRPWRGRWWRKTTATVFDDEAANHWCTPKAVDELEAACKAAGKAVEIFRYDAKHGFVNEQRLDAHDRKAAELAWERTLAFCKKHL